MRPRVGLLTFGCRVNQYETQMMCSLLARGFDLVQDEAEVYLVSACTVTSLAERKARQAIRRLRREHPQAKILLIGCLADAVGRGLSDIQGADLLGGNAWKGEIHEAVHRALAGERGMLPSIDPIPLDQERIARQPGRVRAFLKVQDGCDFSCTFCRTTQIRGPSRSKPIAATVTEARSLVERGCPEVVLTGINLAQYSPSDGDLAKLVRELVKIGGLRRLRFGSINPAGITQRLLEVVASDRRFCPHFHIPLQSGDDAILRCMNRGYTASFYLSRIELVRRFLPDATFGADVIVGFPGETEAAFARTCSIVEEVGFVNLHVFRYSPRVGTKASDFPRAVSDEQRRNRAQRLAQLARMLRERCMEAFLGRVEGVLVEENRNGHWRGYTRGYIDTVLEGGNGIAAGDEVPVRIADVFGDHLEGVKDG